MSLPGVTGSPGEAMGARLGAALGTRYRVERELGEGGMAVVYLARDLRHDRLVALKVLRPELSAQLGAERFLREIRIAAQLHHPHVLALHDSGEADGLLYYVMPFVEGESLRDRLARTGPLPAGEAVSLAMEVADGLAHAHRRGVVHRDIKPENILLTGGHAIVADFGIARAVAGADTAITSTGMSVGTPLYMSPEQAAGGERIDHRADVYALGCVLYEMLAGRPPYPGPTPLALMAQHAAEPIPSARAVRPEVPEAADAAARRAMAKDPADRFPTAEAFRDALGAAWGPGSAAEASASRGADGAAAAGGERAGPARPPAVRARRGRLRAAAAGIVLVLVGGAALLLTRGRPASVAAARAPLRVVVRPFEDRTGSHAAAAAGIAEALTRRLQRVPALDVVAYPVVAELRSSTLDSLRARFHPDRVVTGHLDDAAGRLAVAVDIVDAHTGTSEGDSAVTVAAGAPAAEAVAEPLSVYVRHAFWTGLEREAGRARVRSDAAWRLVEAAQARQEEAASAIQLRLDGQGFRSLDLADSLLRLAQREDGASDLIVVDLAANAERRAFYLEALGQMLSNLPRDLPSPAAARRRALGILDPLIRERHGPADALELRGRVLGGLYRELHADSLLRASIADLRAATDLDVTLVAAWQELGIAYLAAGLPTDALWATEHAIDQDVFQLHGMVLLRERFDAALRAVRFDVADEACRTGAAEWPGMVQYRDCAVQLWSRTRSDRRSAALARHLADSLAAGEPMPIERPLREFWVAEILARAGLADSADRTARRAMAGAPAPWRSFLLAEEAYLRVVRHQPDSALACLREVVRRDPAQRAYVRTAPDYAPLRADPRFTALVGAAPPR